MAILFHCDGDPHGHMFEAIRAALPGREIRRWPEAGNRDEITAAIVWQPPARFFDDLPRLEHVLALSAGVDGLLKHPGLPPSVPIVRLHDAGMGDFMADYVLYGVLHARRRMPALLAAARKGIWLHDIVVPRPAAFGVGILGAGALGRYVASRLADQGYRVACWSRGPKTLPRGVAHHAGPDGLETLLASSDVLVCLLPLTEATRDMLDRDLFERLPRGAFLINAARGEHLVEADLVAALDDASLSGALLDVFRTEPLPAEHAFHADPRIIVTPHLAAPSDPRGSAVQIADSLAVLERGERPPGLVDRARGY